MSCHATERAGFRPVPVFGGELLVPVDEYSLDVAEDLLGQQACCGSSVRRLSSCRER